MRHSRSPIQFSAKSRCSGIKSRSAWHRPQRTIFHVDMDAFFVSVEELFDPSLKGKPVVVGGQAHERGVVSAASYAARKFGVHSAMPLRTAAKLCPQAVFVDGHPERYREYSGKVYEVLNRFSPKLEMVSIDEAYVDMTGTERLHGPPLSAAHSLHQAMKVDDQSQLFDRYRHVAADRQSLLRPGQAKRCVVALFPAERLHFWPRSRCEKSLVSAKSWKSACRTRGFTKLATWQRTTNAGFRRISALWDWRSPASHAASMREPGSTATSGLTRDRAPSATNIHSTTILLRHRCWRRCWRGCRRWCAAACGNRTCTRAPCN